MKNIKNFEEFSINEELSFSDLKDKFNILLKKIKDLNSESRMKIIRNFLISALVIFPLSNVIQISQNLDSQIVKSEITESLKDILKDKGFGDATKMRLSQQGWDMIKKHEGYSSKAYKLGDGMITIGWGHAEPISSSKYKAGQEISEKEAMELLKGDLKVAADGVRRIFTEWKDSGKEIMVTQDMFDSLVSLAFNSGISSLRQSELIQKLKRGDYEGAGELIKSYKISQKFKGLEKRRAEESKTFLSFNL